MTLSEDTICWLGFLAALVIGSSQNPRQTLAHLMALWASQNASKDKAENVLRDSL